MNATLKQFSKYLVIGVLGTVLYAIVFAILNETIFVVSSENLANVNELNYILSNTVAFIITNIFVYIQNKKHVFRSGRHSKIKEMFLFYFIGRKFFVFER